METSSTGMMIAVVAAAVASILLTRLALAYLRSRAVLDHPNDRSSHTVPVPRGGGLGVVVAALVVWPAALWIEGDAPDGPTALVAAGAVVLAVLGWLDDVRGLGASTRFVVQGVCVAAVLAALPSSSLVWQGWFPVAADRVLTWFAWMWVINLFNFMDGIDGLSGAELVSVGAGVVLLSLLGFVGGEAALLAAVLAGVAGGFLVWNWHPARVFLGDVGSLPLGFLLGWLLLLMAVSGHWAAALILPAYYFGDATLTLLKRTIRRQPVWRAHREHFYQRAVQSGWPHDAVVTRISVGNALLVACAVAASAWSAWAVAAAAAAATGLLAHLQQLARQPRGREAR